MAVHGSAWLVQSQCPEICNPIRLFHRTARNRQAAAQEEAKAAAEEQRRGMLMALLQPDARDRRERLRAPCCPAAPPPPSPSILPLPLHHASCTLTMQWHASPWSNLTRRGL